MLQMWRQAAKNYRMKARILCIALALPLFLGWIPATASAQEKQAVQDARSKAFYQEDFPHFFF